MGLGTVADLAPSLTMGLKDDMWRLEARGAESDVKSGGINQSSNIMFVRGETQSKAVEEMVSAENPDEIDISEEEEDEEKDAQIANIEEMDVPDKVFGGLKKDSE